MKKAHLLFVILLVFFGCEEQLNLEDAPEETSNIQLQSNTRANNTLATQASLPAYWMFHREDGSDRLYYSWSDNGLNWYGNVLMYWQIVDWNGKLQTVYHNSEISPSAIFFNDKFMVFGTQLFDDDGRGGNPAVTDHIYNLQNIDGVSWRTPERKVSNCRTTKPISLLKYNNKLYLYYINTFGQNEIMVTSTTDGLTWQAPAVLNGEPGISSNTEVSVANLNGVFYLVYTNNDGGTNRLRYRSSSDGINWSAPKFLCDNPSQCSQYFSSDKGVSAVIHDNSLNVIAKEPNGKLVRFVKDCQCVECWCKTNIGGALTSQRPSAISYDGKITTVYRNFLYVNKINSSYSPNGYNWYGGGVAIGTTSTGPSLMTPYN